MKMPHFYNLLLISIIASGCFSLPENHMPLTQRSVYIDSDKHLKQILANASVEPPVILEAGHPKIIHLKGSPYEMGLQHGSLLKQDVRDCIYNTMRKIRFYATPEMLDEVYDLMAPYIPVEEIEEMRGLAHGAEIPLRVVHWFHALPEATEYSGREQFTKKFKGTSCSNIAATGIATADRALYQLRVLDWNRKLGIQKWPLIIVRRPKKGYASVSYSYAGFIGSVSGMNSKKIALGEMGYGSPSNESLEGIPFVFLFRKLLRETSDLKQVADLITRARRTCSYIYLASDGKAVTQNALLLVTNRDTVETYTENQQLVDYRNGDVLPPMKDIVYAGARKNELIENLRSVYGKISAETLMVSAQKVSMKSNVQNVIFKPATLESWVSNASPTDKKDSGKACNQKWFYYKFNPE